MSENCNPVRVILVHIVLLFLCCSMLSSAHAADRPVNATPGDHLILDGSGYFRLHTEFGVMRLNGDILRNEDDKTISKKTRKRIERTTKRLLKHRNYDWTKTDWRDEACYHASFVQAGDDTRGVALLPSILPPANWAELDFDDSSFQRQRCASMPKRLSTQGRQGFVECQNLHRRGLYARTYFEVPDPADGGDLTIKVVYRGGARILINGKELARSHLPEGGIAPETYGDAYTLVAYQAHEKELPKRKVASPFVGDLRGSFDAAPVDKRVAGPFRQAFGGANLNRDGWDRLTALRDRVLGPIRIPAALLKKGSNVLAIQLRSSRYHPAMVTAISNQKHGGPIWPHLGLIDVELRGTVKNMPSCLHRPGRMQAWAADMHNRLFDRDFNPHGWPTGVVRFVGAQNGTFAAQIGIGADKELTGLTAAVSELTAGGSALIPAEAIRVRYLMGHGLDKMWELGWNRCFAKPRPGILCPMATIPLLRYNGAKPFGELPKGVRAAREARDQIAKQFKFFDHIGSNPPRKVAANTCQPVWLSLEVPADAAPGKYKGHVRIKADGCPPLSIPVEAEISGWRVPDPGDFQMIVQSEQSPYGVAKAYQADLWSDRHFQLMETSFRQLARVGNRWLFIPVLINSEFGNREDGMIKWIRRKDGSLSFDYALLDRYLALAQKHLGRPKVICFVIMHGAASETNAVRIFDETAGKTETVELGKKEGRARDPLWTAFGRSVQAHMQSLGLADAMFWGHGFDDTHDPELIALMAQVTPGVGWAAGSHNRKPEETFRAVAAVYGPDLPLCSMQGWKNPYLYLLMPRTYGSVICVEGASTPFSWRVMCDRTIYCGMNGLGRMGADYFDSTWMDGARYKGWLIVGRASVQTLWPGAEGVESSVRNETMLEGIQEAEARIFLEQALDRKVLPDALAKEVERVLTDHFRSTLHLPVAYTDPATMDMHGNWQGRSRLLFRAAAKAAKQVGLDVDRNHFGRTKVKKFKGFWDGKVVEAGMGKAVSVPVLGKTRLTLKLRNWTAKPRTFKAAADAPWIKPEKTGGTVTGQQELGIILDGGTLKADSDVEGVLTITDTESGAESRVRIAARATRPIDFKVSQYLKYETGGGHGGLPHSVATKLDPVFNLSPGATESLEYPLTNHTSARQSWKIEASHDWVTLKPGSGELAPGSTMPVKIMASPKGGEIKTGCHEISLVLTACSGAFKERYPIKAYVIPAYQSPVLPTGEAVYLNDLDQKQFVKSHIDLGSGRDPKNHRKPAMPFYHRNRKHGEGLWRLPNMKDKDNWPICPYAMGSKSYKRGLWAYPHHETVYAIGGAGFTAFAADVGFFDKASSNPLFNDSAKVCFEIYADNKLCAQSGLMGVKDEPRLLVVDNLQGVKEIKLVTRRENLSSDENCLATWGDPRFFR